MVKGETHCLLPDCDEITWPFKNYCGRRHAVLGQQMGLKRNTIATILCPKLK